MPETNIKTRTGINGPRISDRQVGPRISGIELIQNQIIFAKRKNLDEHKLKMTALDLF